MISTSRQKFDWAVFLGLLLTMLAQPARAAGEFVFAPLPENSFSFCALQGSQTIFETRVAAWSPKWEKFYHMPAGGVNSDGKSLSGDADLVIDKTAGLHIASRVVIQPAGRDVVQVRYEFN